MAIVRVYIVVERKFELDTRTNINSNISIHIKLKRNSKTIKSS